MSEYLNTIEIKKFKSIEHIKFECKRVNVFVGPPNCGKSNILESVGLLGAEFVCVSSEKKRVFKNFVRSRKIADIFRNKRLKNKIEFKSDLCDYEIIADKLYFSRSDILQDLNIDRNKIPTNAVALVLQRFKKKFGDNETAAFFLTEDLSFKFFGSWFIDSSVKNYKFDDDIVFSDLGRPFLHPPDGSNLPEVLNSNEELRAFAAGLFESYGKKMVVTIGDSNVSEQIDLTGSMVAQFPFHLMSDGLKRILFNFAAVITNENSIVLLEEPESHYYPYYSKLLAEKAALRDNQYFFTTHNPTFILTLLSKIPKEELAIHYVDFDKKNRCTRIRTLSEGEFQSLLDYDVDPIFELDQLMNSGK